MILLAAACCCSRGTVAPRETAAAPAVAIRAPRSVLTHRYDTFRSGVNADEVELTPASVAAGLDVAFRRRVDGDVYAQPLIGVGVDVSGGTRNILIVATARNNVYAFDADSPSARDPFWHVSLGPAVVMPNPAFPSCPSACIQYKRENNGVFPPEDVRRQTLNHPGTNLREIGIIGLPAIDPATQTVFLVALERNDEVRRQYDHFNFDSCAPATRADATYHHVLYAIDLKSGRTLRSAVISASVAGTGLGSARGVLRFNSLYQLQRAALLLQGNTLYVAFAGIGDVGPYHGWVLAYDAATLAQRSAFVTTPDADPEMRDFPSRGEGDPSNQIQCAVNPGQASEQSGIWQSGNGPSTDASGDVLVSTGNGSLTIDRGGRNVGSSVVKLRNADGGPLELIDWFAPFWNRTSLPLGCAHGNCFQQNDEDLGSSGPVYSPRLNLILAVGKQGILYLIDPQAMGHFDPARDRVVQSVQATWKTNCANNAHVHGSPIAWHSAQGEFVYVWGEEDYLKAYQVRDRVIPTAASAGSCGDTGHLVAFGVPALQGTAPAPPGMPGGILTISSNGDSAGIVWALHPTVGDGLMHVVPATLEAYDATALGAPIWSSERSASTRVGYLARFTPPVVANGKVYVVTFSNEVVVYSLRP